MPTPSIWASTDYALDWPIELLTGELAAVRAKERRPMCGDEVVEVPEAARGDRHYTSRRATNPR